MSENIQVPKGWEVKKLGEVGLFLKGKGIKKDELVTQGLPCIIYGQIYTTYDYYTHNLISFIPEYMKHSTTEIFKNDILFAGSGETKEEIGKSITYLGNTSAYAGGDIIILRQNVLISKYITFYLNSIGRKQLNKLGQGDSVVHIYKSSLEKINIPVPPLEEQKKIAEILSLWDKAIEQTKDLIAYKEKQKKGLMQKFIYSIKNKTSYRIGDLFNLSRGRVISKQEIEENTGIYPVFSSQTSNNGILGYINTYDYDDELITWTTDGANAGKVFARKGKFNCTNVCGIGKPKSNNICNLIYISAFLNNITKRYVSYVGNPKLMNNVFEEIEIFLPPIDEQKAIADILSSADKEIELLNKQLELYTEQKKGLMQNLLTGKVRV